MEVQVSQPEVPQNARPQFLKHIRLALPISPRLPKEHQVGVNGPYRVVQRHTKDFCCCTRQRNHTRRAVLCVLEGDDPSVEIYLGAAHARDFRRAHAGFDGQPHNPPEHRVAMGGGGGEEPPLLFLAQTSIPTGTGARLANIGDWIERQTNPPLLNGNSKQMP